MTAVLFHLDLHRITSFTVNDMLHSINRNADCLGRVRAGAPARLSSADSRAVNDGRLARRGPAPSSIAYDHLDQQAKNDDNSDGDEDEEGSDSAYSSSESEDSGSMESASSGYRHHTMEVCRSLPREPSETRRSNIGASIIHRLEEDRSQGAENLPMTQLPLDHTAYSPNVNSKRDCRRVHYTISRSADWVEDVLHGNSHAFDSSSYMPHEGSLRNEQAQNPGSYGSEDVDRFSDLEGACLDSWTPRRGVRL